MIYTVTLNPALDKTLLATGLRPDQINRAQIVRCDWGGKGINVSRALRQLGGNSLATGFVGGATGAALERGLDDLGIAHHLLPIKGETRVNLTIHDQDRQALIKLNEAGPTIGQSEMAQLGAWIAQQTQAGDYWVLSGNLPPGLAADCYATLIAQIQERGGRACLDTSGEPLQVGSRAAPFLLKPNRAEAETILGCHLDSPQDLARGLDALLKLGIACVLLSLGADGAMVAYGAQRCWARPPRVTVASDIGAGDSMLAGFVLSQSLGRGIEDALRWAVAAGTAATMEEGSGVCQRARVEQLYAQVVSGEL